MNRRIATAFAATAAALLALTACSTDVSAGDSPPAPSRTASADPAASATPTPAHTTGATGTAGTADADALEQAVRTYAKALFGGDGDLGYPILSERCKTQLPRAEFAAMADQAHHDYGPLTVKTFAVDKISGDLARVSYGVGVPQFEREGQAWTRENGTWRWDAC